MPPQSEQITVLVDRERFLNTRNALTNAFVGLSGAIDVAVKAYVTHTNAVLDGVGGNSLDIGGLLQPFNGLGSAGQFAHLAQQAILQNGNGNGPFALAAPTPDGPKRKRQYKPRDKNAPKRPLTAYFRYLQEMRPRISDELKQSPNESGRAGDISKMATERWNALPDIERRPYREAYEAELVEYHKRVEDYKKSGGGDIDTTGLEDGDPPKSSIPTIATAADDEEDDEDDDDDDDDDTDSSDDDSEDESADELPVPAQPRFDGKPHSSTKASQEKKTLKSAPKTVKAGADPLPQQTFNSLQAPSATMVPQHATSSQKRKADEEADVGDKKKKRKSKAEREAEDQAAAASQLLQIDPQLTHAPYVPDVSPGAEKMKKEKKKKRRAE